MTSNSDCIFCKIVEGEIPSVKIWEDEKHLAILDVNPISRGHALVLLKKHEDYIFDLEDKEYLSLMLAVKKIAKIIKDKLKPRRVGLLVEGFLVPHAHVHLVPINHVNELNPERARPSKKEELERVAMEITR
jgi:histidine triad (HIT) family protein